jgi:hypothetical protein
MELKQKFVTEDGKQFDTRQEALVYVQKPHQIEAFNKLIPDNADFVEFLIERRDDIEGAFESTKIQRVTKAEKKQLEKALEAVKNTENKAFNFLIDNAAAIVNSFRWPSVQRMKPEEAEIQVKKALLEIFTEDNGEAVEWAFENKDAILEAYQAGVVKREINPKAQEALATWRAEQAKKKAAIAAAQPQAATTSEHAAADPQAQAASESAVDSQEEPVKTED